jgi:hypothetical protein
MALDQAEIIATLSRIATVGEEARALAEAIKSSREDGEVTDAERKTRRKATKALARKLIPIAGQLALDVMD